MRSQNGLVECSVGPVESLVVKSSEGVVTVQRTREQDGSILKRVLNSVDGVLASEGGSVCGTASAAG